MRYFPKAVPMNISKTPLALLGIAFGILLALLLAPQTRWLVRFQMAPSTSTSPNRYEQQKQEVVHRHPNDYQIQLAGQTGSDQRTQVEYARSLVSRFPDNASLRANILRYATVKEVHLDRDEYYLLQGQPVPVRRADPNDPPPTLAHLAAFDANAAAGERLDPDNAYFPFMRAFGLFAAHRDAEGLAAVERASTKHSWHEYFDDEVEGRWRINSAVNGGQEAVSAMAVSAALEFPHYQVLRGEARVVVYKAILDEQAGHPEAGLAKREALGRCGELMGTQAQSLIGNLVGVAINAISRTRPGGAPPLKAAPGQDGSLLAQKRLDLYCAYVTKIGHPEAAAEAQRDYQTWQQIHHATSKLDDFSFGIGLKRMLHLIFALIADWIVFPNLLSLFVLGLAASGLGRLPSLQERRPLPAGATVGFWSVVALGLLMAAAYVDSAAGYISFDAGSFWLISLLLAFVPLLFAAVRALALRRQRHSIVTAVLTAAATISVVVVFSVLLSWQTHGGSETISTVQQMVSMSGSDSNAGTTIWNNPGLQTLLGTALALAVPLLLAVVLSIMSRVKRVPVSVGLVNGFRVVMPPLVCALMLVYGGLTLWTVRQEARANYGLERSLHGEGQYLAEITGQAWPK